MNENRKEIARLLLETAGLSELATELPPLPEGFYELSPNVPELKGNYIFYYPKTIDDVRRVAGVPREIANANRDKMTLPLRIAEAKEQVKSLGAEENPDEEALQELATELLLYPIEDEDLSGPYAQAKEYMMKRAAVLPVLLADNLEVKNGETYVIKNTATAVFGTITVHGSGTIRVPSTVKVFADSVCQLDQ